jgi:hypothetical protein
MGTSTEHARVYPEVIPYGDPTLFGSPGLTKSLCLQHPIYGECPLAYKPHECDQCEQCAVYGRGTCEDPLTWEPPPPVQEPQPADYRNIKPHKCKMPWCENQTKKTYCQACANLVNCRNYSHRKQTGKDASEEYLHREREHQRRSVKNSGRKYAYHPDDESYAPILYYPSKLAAAKKLGYESFKECVILLYSKYKSLRKVGELIGMSGQGVSQNLTKMGVKINKHGGPRR